MVLERVTEVQKTVYMCFIDFEKAFDTVKHECLINMLQEIGVDGKDERLIANLYWSQKAAVRVGGEMTDWIQIRKEVRQGRVLSPDLFSLYGQRVIEDLEDMDGILIGGRNVNNIRYADDTVLLADTEEKLQALVNRI